MGRIDFTVDADEYYEGFIKSSSIDKEDSIIELAQNIHKNKTSINKLTCDFYNKNLDKLDTSTDKKFKRIIGNEEYKHIVYDDNSEISMTCDNGRTCMVSLQKTIKSKNISCFNFGEILAMSTLTDGDGVVLYLNKKNKEKWCINFPKNKTPYMDDTISDSKYLELLDHFDKISEYQEVGTLKIIITNDELSLNLDYTKFENVCDYINIDINSNEFKPFKINKMIADITKTREYDFKINNVYHIAIIGDIIDKYSVIIGKIKYKNDGTINYSLVNDVSKNSKANSKSKQFKNISKTQFYKIDWLMSIDIKSIILPKEYYEYLKTDLKNIRSIYYNVCGFNLNINSDPILKLIYPNIGGNDCLKNSYTNINVNVLKIEDSNDNDKLLHIKKNLLNFYPDKGKSGNPIITWKYIKNYIIKDFEKHYNNIKDYNDNNELFQVRNKYYPDINNKLWELKKNEFISFDTYEDDNEENGDIADAMLISGDKSLDDDIADAETPKEDDKSLDDDIADVDIPIEDDKSLDDDIADADIPIEDDKSLDDVDIPIEDDKSLDDTIADADIPIEDDKSLDDVDIPKETNDLHDFNNDKKYIIDYLDNIHIKDHYKIKLILNIINN